MKDLDGIYVAASELPPEGRPAFLDQACAGHPALRARVEQMLAVAEEAEAFITDIPDEPKSGAPGKTIKLDLPEAPDEVIGQKIGRYKILERLGEGGCGVVYVAEQTEPVRRRVALKVIMLGMDTKQVVARFEAERQALALMDHPNIAKVLDAGCTEAPVASGILPDVEPGFQPGGRGVAISGAREGSHPGPGGRMPAATLSAGRPYFVMELVRGVKITDYCDQNNLSTKDRLDLFIKVCQAIQHAHQKGIIHRDIKPSNILVTLHDGVPVPKVIDFGIAKATEGRLTDATIYTQLHQFIGTPAYMSPEQAEMSGLDIDTRSDIYSLGVLLYELLAGRPPFEAQELMSRGIDAMRKTIREKEPVRPSLRLATLQGDELTTTAKRRAVEAPKLIRQMKGDLDWIVMKCLEKDRQRRYETANGLAADIQRHLNTEPVVARPPSKFYEFQKTVRRHKVGFAVTSLVILVLAVGMILTTWQAVRASRAEKKTAAERDAKEVARQEAETIAQFLGEVFRLPSPERDGRTTTVVEALEKAARKLESNLSTQPARRAKLQEAIGTTYRSLGYYPEAIALQQKVYEYHLATAGREAPETLAAMHNLAVSLFHEGRHVEALKLREEVFALRLKQFGSNDIDTLRAMNNLALSYASTGRREEALALRLEVLSARRELLGLEHAETLEAMQNLAGSYAEAGRREEAIKLREEVWHLRAKVLPRGHPNTITVMLSLANDYAAVGRGDEALKLREAVLPLQREVFGSENRSTLATMNTLAFSCAKAGRWDEALQLREELLTLGRKVNGPEHPDTLTAMNNLARSYSDAGRKDEAAKLRAELEALKVKAPKP